MAKKKKKSEVWVSDTGCVCVFFLIPLYSDPFELQAFPLALSLNYILCVSTSV